MKISSILEKEYIKYITKFFKNCKKFTKKFFVSIFKKFCSIYILHIKMIICLIREKKKCMPKGMKKKQNSLIVN